MSTIHALSPAAKNTKYEPLTPAVRDVAQSAYDSFNSAYNKLAAEKDVSASLKAAHHGARLVNEAQRLFPQDPTRFDSVTDSAKEALRTIRTDRTAALSALDLAAEGLANILD